MNIPFKLKLRLALVFLFGLLLAVIVVSHVALFRLTDRTKNIFLANYRSLEYVEQMRTAFDGADFQTFKNVHAQQAANLTEVGEPEATTQLGLAARRYEADRSDTAARQQVRSELSRIHALNRDAIVRANDQTYQMADGYGTLLAIIGTLAALLGFTFVVNFPDYVARPVARLKAGIVEITQKNYATRIHEHSHDEFGDVTYAFNQMAEQLEQWEKSNMASVIRANQRLEAIIALLPDAAIGLDEQEKILFVNPAAADLLALRPESVVGRSAPEVATHHDLLREILQTEGEVGGKKSIFNIFSAGEARKFALHSFVVTNREGGHLGRVWYLQLQSL